MFLEFGSAPLSPLLSNLMYSYGFKYHLCVDANNFLASNFSFLVDFLFLILFMFGMVEGRKLFPSSPLSSSAGLRIKLT